MLCFFLYSILQVGSCACRNRLCNRQRLDTLWNIRLHGADLLQIIGHVLQGLFDVGRVQRKNTVALQTKSRITGMVDLVAVLHHALVEQCRILDLPPDIRVDHQLTGSENGIHIGVHFFRIGYAEQHIAVCIVLAVGQAQIRCIGILLLHQSQPAEMEVEQRVCTMVLRKSYLDKIIPFIDQDLIKVLVGIRRCGKTVLLGQIKDVLLQRNIPAQNIIQANFESMRFRNTRTAETLYDYIAEKAEGCTGKIYILLDEIQEVERWQIAINSLRVDFDCDIYLTGSNSKLLSGELATYLSGRYIQIQVFPFSLAEAKQQCIENGTYTSDEKLFADYLKYGGFPQRFFLPDDHSITTYLDDLYEAIIVRDIMLRHNIREQTALRNVLAFLLDNIGNPFSARNISGRMVSEGIKTTTATVLNYVDYFKEAFILLNASRYDIKGKALLSSTEKYYAVDLGLRNVIKKSEKLDSNKLYENIVYLEMRSRGYEVQFGKLDDTEIDFICYRGDEKLYIQVAYLITPADEEREFGNLERLHDNYPKYVISGDLMNLSRNGIIHRNIIDFLLNP